MRSKRLWRHDISLTIKLCLIYPGRKLSCRSTSLILCIGKAQPTHWIVSSILLIQSHETHTHTHTHARTHARTRARARTHARTHKDDKCTYTAKTVSSRRAGFMASDGKPLSVWVSNSRSCPPIPSTCHPRPASKRSSLAVLKELALLNEVLSTGLKRSK